MNIFSNISLDTILAILGFAGAIGGLYPTLRLDNDRKKIIIVAVLVVFFTTSIVAFVKAEQHQDRVAFVSQQIQEKIGTGIMTFDQLYQQIFFPDLADLSEAMDNLIKKNIVGQKILQMRDDQGAFYSVRVYYKKSE
jgi:predicted MFS family arabinose efflux permease